MSSQRLKDGALVKIDLGDGRIAFGRVLNKAEIAFYDFVLDNSKAFNIGEIYTARIAFIVAVMNSAVKTGRWPIIDKWSLEPTLVIPRRYFVHDRLTGEYSIYLSTDGSIRAATALECEGLECAAVWEPEHVEERLRDHFAGKKNYWAEKLRSG